MKHSLFWNLIVPTLNSRENINLTSFRCTNYHPHFFDVTGRKTHGNVGLTSKTPSVATFVTLLSSSQNDGNNNIESPKTKRLPLGKIFNGERDYLFTTKKNIRGYEWEVEEAEELFESISEIDPTSKNNGLELNSMIVMKINSVGQFDERGRNIGQSSDLYDVHDGQQRLVTLSLLFAAIRDELLEKLRDSKDNEAIAKEVSNMIYPLKPRLDPICRVELRGSSGNKTLHTLLSRTDPNSGCSLDDDGDYKEMASMFPKKGSWRRLETPECDQRILKVYNYFRMRIEELKEEEEIFDLLEKIRNDVRVNMFIPSDTITARNMVMGQRKGKDIEPVDEFKGMICFTYIDEESIQDSTLESWNKLCDEIGRNVLEDACLLLAQRDQETRVKRNGEVTLVEKFLRDSNKPNERNHGEFLFRKEIAPAARMLHDLRKGIFTINETAGKDETEPPSLGFLRAAASIASCREIEMAILALAMKYREDKGDKFSISLKLKKLESIALWMMTTKPRPKDRFRRCLEIIEGSNQMSLTVDEKQHICKVLDDQDFGKPADRKKAAAILDRLNEYILVDENSNRLQPMQAGRHIEHVLPQQHQKNEHWSNLWLPSDASQWKQRLGNLALLDMKSNSKIGNKGFEQKKDHLRQSPYPLTRDIAKSTMWDVNAVEANHEKYMALAKKVWNL